MFLNIWGVGVCGLNGCVFFSLFYPRMNKLLEKLKIYLRIGMTFENLIET